MALRKFVLGKRNKYNAEATIVDGIKFHSRKEARRYQELKWLEKLGQVKNLRRQVPYPIVINGITVCKYYADFVYEQNHITIVEDSKGFETQEYKIKRKLMYAVHGVQISQT